MHLTEQIIPSKCARELKWVVVLSKEWEWKPDTGSKPLLSFYYLLHEARPMFSRRHTKKKKESLPGCRQIKFNKTNRRAPFFVCLLKTKNDLHAAKWGAGTATFTWRILRRQKQASAILLKVIFFPFGPGCTDGSHYSGFQGQDASVRDSTPPSHLNEVTEHSFETKKGVFDF